VKRACFEAYRAAGITPDMLPLFVGPVVVCVDFRLDHGDRFDGPPDGDKLLRSTWDALGGSKHGARVFEDDSRIVDWAGTKRPADSRGAGARIEVRPWPVDDEAPAARMERVWHEYLVRLDLLLLPTTEVPSTGAGP
jgi:hypothetical protein